jgi:multidrug transporter EmrE-like cation transporter
MKLGLLVTMLVSVCVYGEMPGIWETLGFGLAVAAIILINYNKEGGKGKFRFGLIGLLLCGGMADAMSKLYEEWGTPEMKDHFLLYTFLVALLLCIVLCLVRREKLCWQDAVFGLALGVPNYLSTRFLLLSLAELPAVVVFPTFSVGTIVLVTLAGMLFFREKLPRRKAIALGVILAALVMLNL